jgi:glycerol-3-phosphate acyltransferase PlsX
MIEGIERPAIAALWPTLKGIRSVVLDVGASIGADEAHLVNLAAMGSAMARVLFDIERPTVGLLNIGVEEVKGLEQVREAGRTLREGQFPHFDYHGFVEGDDIGKGAVDVVVTEGFAGNIALKTVRAPHQLPSNPAQCPPRPSRVSATACAASVSTLRDEMDPRPNSGDFSAQWRRDQKPRRLMPKVPHPRSTRLHMVRWNC